MKRRTLLGAISASMIGMAGCLGADEYTLSEPDVEQTDDPLQIDAELSGREVTIEGPSTLTLTLENTGEKPLEIRTTNLWPFGLPALGRTNDQHSREILLLSDRYEETDSVNISVEGNGILNMRTQGQTVTQVLAPAEPISKEYTLRGDLIWTDGTYELQRSNQGRPARAGRNQQGNGPAQQGNQTGQQGNESGQQGNQTAQPNQTAQQPNTTAQQRPQQNNWQYLFEFRPEGGEQYYAYQPTVSITVSTKGLLPEL